MSDEGDFDALLEERPELREALEAVAVVDERQGTWEFDDVPLDSGTFGELVASGVVESVGDEYRIGDTDALSSLLGDETTVDEPLLDVEGSLPALHRPTIDRTATGALAAALAFVALVRVHPFASIYRNGDIVLSGNDPYFYRYWVERIIIESNSVFNLDALSALPPGVTQGEPLFVATLWWVAAFFGKSTTAVGNVMAWYPVVSAVVTGIFVYLLAVSITGDKRVGLAAVLLFAIVPGHALRTSLGYADHHAFDYLWLAVTAFTLTILAGTKREALTAPRTWLASAGFGIAITGQIMAWNAAPILIAAVGLALIAVTLSAVDSGEFPFVAGVPVLVGLTLATGLCAMGHLIVGWHTPRVAFAPALILSGSLLVVGIAELVARTTGEVRHLASIDAISFSLSLVVFRYSRPGDWEMIVSSTRHLTTEQDIAETAGLFNPDSLGFLLLLGFMLVIALPAMIISAQWAREDPRWAIPLVYVWYFLGLSALSVRFVGELTPVLALFAGVGFVRLADWIDVVEPLDFDASSEKISSLSLPDRRTMGTLVMLFLLVGSLGIVQVPVKTSQLTIDDSTYQSASFVANHSASLNDTESENYVLSQWGRNRVYNYFVSGESRNYKYALRTHQKFLQSTDADEWYAEFSNRVGYVVLSREINSSSGTVHGHLTNDYGSRTPQKDGVSHYKALYVSPGGEKIIYRVVPGAMLIGQTEPNTTVTAKTDVKITDAEFTYERQVMADVTGNYSIRVANPGKYVITTHNDSRETTVSMDAIRNGTDVVG